MIALFDCHGARATLGESGRFMFLTILTHRLFMALNWLDSATRSEIAILADSLFLFALGILFDSV